jgi:hypothetical protein
MKTLSRHALGLAAASASLVACGGSESPIGAPGAMPQSSAIATHAQRGGSWMLAEAKSEELIYVTSADLVSAYTTSGKLVGNLQVQGTKGLCSDSNGDVFIPDGGAIYEYAHGGTEPIATLNGPSGYYSAYGCAVDPTSGNLAVTDFSHEFGASGNVAIYRRASGNPQSFSDSAIDFYVYCGYDDRGNLFVDGMKSSRNNGYLAELPNGGNALTTIDLNETIKRPSAVQWDGQHVAIGDSYDHVVYQLSIAGSQGTVVGTTKFKGWDKGHGIIQFWINNSSILIPYTAHHEPLSLGTWAYPAGGSPKSKFRLQFGVPGGVTISVARSPLSRYSARSAGR